MTAAEHESDLVFAGSVPEFYDRHLVPLIFEPYAADLVDRLHRLGPGSILEIGAGSGVVTRAMAAGLPAPVSITVAVGRLFPDDPPLFLARTPHGYHDPTTIHADLSAGGFSVPAGFDAVDARSLAASCEVPAIAYCQGTPLRNEIETRDPTRLGEATEVAAAAIRDRFGAADLEAKIRGFVITATRP